MDCHREDFIGEGTRISGLVDGKAGEGRVEEIGRDTGYVSPLVFIESDEMALGSVETLLVPDAEHLVPGGRRKLTEHAGVGFHGHLFPQHVGLSLSIGGQLVVVDERYGLGCLIENGVHGCGHSVAEEFSDEDRYQNGTGYGGDQSELQHNAYSSELG